MTVLRRFALVVPRARAVVDVGRAVVATPMRFDVATAAALAALAVALALGRRRRAAPPDAAAASMAALPADAAVLWLVRHGDRRDYADKALWAAEIGAAGGEPRDPPLSALGHAQAAAVGKYLSGLLDVERARRAGGGAARAPRPSSLRVLSSPYVRVIQTATPLARREGARIEVCDGLSLIHISEPTRPY